MYIQPIDEQWFKDELSNNRKQSTLRKVHSYLFGPRISEEDKCKRQLNAYFALKGRAKCKVSLDDLIQYNIVSNNLKQTRI